MREIDTRLVPYDQAEVAWARSRPPQHRVATPAVGEMVRYRHEAWGEPVEALVVAVQDPQDQSDPNLWRIARDGHGAPLALDGMPVIVPVEDPWPLLTLECRYGRPVTREARLRGSAGWLPVDWETRHRPLPTFAPVR